MTAFEKFFQNFLSFRYDFSPVFPQRRRQSASGVIRVLLEIIICSLIINIVFFFAFHRAAEFKMLENVLASIRDILRKKSKNYLGRRS